MVTATPNCEADSTWAGAATAIASDAGGTAEARKAPANTALVKGWFQETLPRFLEEHPGPVALLHIGPRSSFRPFEGEC